ncbi:PREDICTED: uncharacterized protein LOC104784484 [Camelina sativa]|uniref:Uncharacterized protein LOC104784484 n=1 Tax=Camelina sativa TaxID=90675 RepID=A0ABM0YY77_CAMSA|nr:PREDICTED: uncharacterized protein LOC104784484 [Camelina sativa]
MMMPDYRSTVGLKNKCHCRLLVPVSDVVVTLVLIYVSKLQLWFGCVVDLCQFRPAVAFPPVHCLFGSACTPCRSVSFLADSSQTLRDVSVVVVASGSVFEALCPSMRLFTCRVMLSLFLRDWLSL